MKTKLAAVAVVALVAWGMKRHYADAGADDLWWILRPTARLVGALASTAFVMVPSEGYVSHERFFVIEKACAGVNFMIAAFAMVALALLHRVRTSVSAVALLAASLAISYAAAIVVNAARITMAMWLAAHPLSALSASHVHRVEGIVVYFAALWLLYELVLRLDRDDQHLLGRAFRRAALPLGCYYTMTLAVPFANGAWRADAAFVGHAAVVATVPLVLVVLVAALVGPVRFLAGAVTLRCTAPRVCRGHGKAGWDGR